MARLYTTEEAYKKLDTSQATFYRWLADAKSGGFSEKVEPQPSVDGRERLYTLSQLRWMATRHGRVLLPDEEIFAHESQIEMEALRRDVESLKQRLDEKEAETLRLRGDVQRLEQHLLAIDAQVQEAYAFCVQQVGQVMAALERVRADVRGLSVAQSPPSLAFVEAGGGGQPPEERREGEGTPSPQSLLANVPLAAPDQPARPSEPVQLSSLAAHGGLIISSLATNKAKERRPTSFFEITRTSDGQLVAFGEFVELHGISLSTAKHARGRSENPLPAVRVRWPKANGYIDWALDVSGQAKLFELYSIKLEFRRCELCPHTPDRYEQLTSHSGGDPAGS